MCGIFAAFNGNNITSTLIDGLRHLEYRGYDSAGIATLINGRIERRRALGKLQNLENLLQEEPLSGRIGIAHTRWATHGEPSIENAHPHVSEQVAVVHNGIIENYRELRNELKSLGYTFESQTDTEVIPHLLSEYLKTGLSPYEATEATIKRLEGSFALAILFAQEQEQLIVARRYSPLAIGLNENAYYVASDANALAKTSKRVIYLEDGDIAILRPQQITVFQQGREVQRKTHPVREHHYEFGKNGHRHFMHKEIFEQPLVLTKTLKNFWHPTTQQFQMTASLPFEFADVERIYIVACGTSYHAAMVAKYWLEAFANLPVEVDIASEFRYRKTPLLRGNVAIFISQSGETADTLAALRHCRDQGLYVLSIVNVAESSIARESDVTLYTEAGPEIGVASTKAFTTQLAVLACLTLIAARSRGCLTAKEETHLSTALWSVPDYVTAVLEQEEALAKLAEQVYQARDVLYLGRGNCYPIALEGALKLKEISYIHAEGYAAGEMKHGPIALIDSTVPIIVLAPPELFDKTTSNLQEVKARGGKIILFSHQKGMDSLAEQIVGGLAMPETETFTAPIIYSIPIQLLAYHAAVLKNTDVDQPRNLAKSVTVE